MSEDRSGLEVVERDIEEPLYLAGVEVERQPMVRPGGLDQVRNEPGRNRDSSRVLAVLARVTVIGDDSDNLARGGSAQGVDDDEEFHQVIVHRWTGRLDDKDVGSSDRLANPHPDLSVIEPLDRGIAQLDPKRV